MSIFKEKVIAYKRELVQELLVQCTEEQQKFFNRLYVSIDSIPEEKLETAYLQCERTLQK